MWLFTPIGFFSIVQKKDETRLTIRSRAASDLDRLRERYLPALSPTVENAGMDYPFRAYTSHEQFAEAMAKIARDIRYANFKDEVGRTLGRYRETIMHEIWEAAAQIEDE